jgi:replicative DNA helicase
MSKINKDSLGYLGLDFQYRLIQQMLTDRKFAKTIIDLISPNYFEDTHLKVIVATIKDAHEKHEAIPDIGSLTARLLENVKDEIDRNSIFSQIRRIESAELNDVYYIQETAIKFCKRQELVKAINKMNEIIKKGDINDYDQCEDILKKALEYGNNTDVDVDVFSNVDEVLSDDYRNPIPTGIEGLDEIMDGGLARGELAIILAAFGVGKTTMVTKLANHAKLLGYNVMQMFFEDTVNVIKRKHMSCYTKIPLNELTARKSEVKLEWERFEQTPGQLRLVKLKSDGTTVPKIKQIIRKKIAQGFKPDLILIDYVDCISPSRHFTDTNEAQGVIMRELEGMIEELDVALWVPTQGNREGLKAEVLEGNHMGGSIKKAQIGHFLLSISKNLEQRENGTANIAILKSRFGQSGIVLEDVIFDNKTVQIDMGQNTNGTSFLGREVAKEQKGQDRVKQIMELANLRKRDLEK